MKKKYWVVILCVALVFTLLPGMAMAAPEEEGSDGKTIMSESLLKDGEIHDTSDVIARYDPDEYKVMNDGQFWFIQEEGGWLKLIGYKGELTGTLVIPTEYGGFPVQAIGEEAFKEAEITGELNIPSCIDSIGRNAFSGCEGLTSLKLNPGLEIIDGGAFENCSGLTGDLFIPDSVASIGSHAFAFDSGFTGTVHFPVNPAFTTLPDHMFYYAGGFTGEVYIPDNVRVISSNAFHMGRFNKATLRLPENLQEIGHWAFIGCSGLTGTLEIPEGVKNIEYGAFSGCYGFTGDLILPDSVEIIEYNAFYNCNNLDGILKLPENLKSIGAKAFWSDGRLQGDLYLPDSVESIGEEAFAYCSNLDGTIHLPENPKYTEIQKGTFNNCGNLAGSLLIPGNINKIGDEAFYYCKNLSGNLVIPESVERICYRAFCGCSGFNGTLSLPDGLNELGYQCFSNCSGFIGDLEIPGTVRSVDSYAFQRCTGFDGTLTINYGVEIIGEAAFSGCSSLTGDLVIPPSVTGMGDDAFSSCKSLTGTLTLSPALKSIPNDAFTYCEGLTGSINLPESIESIGAYAFSHCSGFTGNLRIPDATKNIYQFAFNGCSGLKGTLTIPKSVEVLRDYVFSGTFFDKIVNRSAMTIKVENSEDDPYPSNQIFDKDNRDKYYYVDASGERVRLIENGSYSLKVKEEPPELIDISTAEVSGIADVTYTGKAIKPVPVVKLNGQTLREGTDYSVSYKNNTNAGKASVTITGEGGYTGKNVQTFVIKKVRISSAELEYTSIEFTGKALRPNAVVKAKVNGKVKQLTAGTDYKITYTSNINAGTATAKITGIGNFTGSFTRNFTIKPVKLSAAALSYTSKAYTGKELKPTATVKAKVNGKVQTLTSKDFTITYKNNINVGTATATIKGKGNFTGALKRQFTIKKAANSFSSVTPLSKSFRAADLNQGTKSFKLTATDKFGAAKTFTFTSSTTSKTKKYISLTSAGKVTVKSGTPKGTYKLYIKVSAKGTANYGAASTNKTIRIVVK